MKYCRILTENGAKWAVIEDGKAKILYTAPYEKIEKTGEQTELEKAVLLAPCEPSKIVAVGKNYYDHAVEMNEGIPKNPILFIKATNCISNPNAEIEMPSISNRVDYECELAFIVKKTAKKVKKQNAYDYILGYTCLNDITARDIQKGDGQWTRGKSIDGFAPIGPIITDEINPNNVNIKTLLNGEEKQSSNTSQFMWKIDELIEFITQTMTLYAGDVVTTGTPSQIGPMQSGDIVEVFIEGIGSLKNKMIGEK